MDRRVVTQERTETIIRRTLRGHGFEGVFNRIGAGRRRRTIRQFTRWRAGGWLTAKTLRDYIKIELRGLKVDDCERLLPKIALSREEKKRLQQVKKEIGLAAQFLMTRYRIRIPNPWSVFSTRVIFLSDQDMYKMVGVAEGGFTRLFDAVYLSDNIKGSNRFLGVTIHEWLHLVATGFSSIYLDEAVTEFLTREIMIGIHPSGGRAFRIYTSLSGKEAVQRIAKLTNDDTIDALIRAYFFGTLVGCPIVPLPQAHLVCHGNIQVQLNNGNSELMRFGEALREIQERARAMTGETLLIRFDRSTSPITISRAVAR